MPTQIRSSAMSQNIEYTAIQKCFDTALDLLGSGTVDLTSFGQELVSASFLGQAALNNILNTPGHTTNDKASKLLQCVSAQVKTNPEKSYKAYLDILEHRPALITLLNEIKKEYGKKILEESVWQCTMLNLANSVCIEGLVMIFHS